MKQYIDKDAVVAEIEKRRDKNARNKLNLAASFEDNYLLSFLDTLEVKEVKESADAFIEKACEWLTKYAKKYYFSKEKYLGTEELVEDFKLSMEI